MKINFYQNIGKKIQYKRKEVKLSQKELSQKLGKDSSTYINLIESGKRKVSLEQLIMISEIFECSLNYFIEERNHDIDPDSLLDLALNSQPKLTEAQKSMAHDFIDFLKNRS
jgi:transcriptional regulator with XRE-family HTH domain